MAFVDGFEKTAKTKGLAEALRHIGKSIGYAGKGVGKGVSEHASSTLKKMQAEPKKFKSKWKGFKNPKSYEALSGTATRFAPEATIGALTGVAVNKAMGPENYGDVPMAYQYY
jgi:hypothetical protein